MKKQVLGAITICFALLGSCAKEGAIDSDSAISFNGEISNLQAVVPPTSTASVWNANDKIGIFMLDNGTSNITENNANRQYIFSGTQFAPAIENEIYFPVSNTKVDFVSYYPYKTEYALGTPIVLNLTNQSDISKLDLLYAKSNNGGAGYSKSGATNVPLTFDHKLSKIIIKPVAGLGLNPLDATWTNMNVLIQGLNSICMFDLRTGFLSLPSTPSPMIPFTRIAGVSYELIAIPHEYVQAYSFSFIFQIGSNNYVFNSPANERFEAGKEYTYNVTINKTGLVLDNVTINSWTNMYRTGSAN